VALVFRPKACHASSPLRKALQQTPVVRLLYVRGTLDSDHRGTSWDDKPRWSPDARTDLFQSYANERLFGFAVIDSRLAISMSETTGSIWKLQLDASGTTRPSPTFGRPVHVWGSRLDYGPVLLLMPSDSTSQWTLLPSRELRSVASVHLGCIRLSSSCPFGLLLTFRSLRPATYYGRFWIQRSSAERWRDLNPPDQCAAQRKGYFG
jgi:hypothetical protein